MEILFLGTGAGMPGKLRNVSSMALKLLENRGSVWLFDCGEGTQHQILHTTIKPRRIEKIFITHLHGDHIYGLPGLLSSRSFQGGDEKVTVYGPKGIDRFITTNLEIADTYLRYPLEIKEIEEGIIFEDEEFIVEARELEHRILSYGYRIREKDRPGSLHADKLKEAGIPPGPLYKKIKDGEDITLEDGRIFKAADFVGEPQTGRIVTILGDTKVCDAGIALAADANLLVHEATFAAGEDDLANEYFHATTTQAAQVAKVARVKKLCMTHVSSRYDKSDWKQLLEEARAVFPNSYLAEDFKEISVPLEK